MKKIPNEEGFKRRFYEKLEQIRKGKEDCWVWRWSKTSQGYGSVSAKDIRYSAHRVSFHFESKEPLMEGLVLDHTCSQRLCINPNHLRQVTIAENIALEFVRFPEKWNWEGRTNLSRGSCIRGHLIQTKEDLVIVGIKKKETKCKRCYQLNNRSKKEQGSVVKLYRKLIPLEKGNDA